MSERYLKRRPTWHRYAIIAGMMAVGATWTHVERYVTGRGGTVPLWAVMFGSALFTFAAMTEMSQTLSWNDRSIRMHPRWGFKYLGYRTLEIAVADITEISVGYMSNETLGGKPFTIIRICGESIVIPIRTSNFFREGIQELVCDIVRFRPDLEIPDNLRGYMQGEFDGYWPD